MDNVGKEDDINAKTIDKPGRVLGLRELEQFATDFDCAESELPIHYTSEPSTRIVLHRDAYTDRFARENAHRIAHVDGTRSVDPVFCAGQLPSARRAALVDHLSGVKVFKVGSTKLAVYIVGTTADGHRAGVKAEAIET